MAVISLAESEAVTFDDVPIITSNLCLNVFDPLLLSEVSRVNRIYFGSVEWLQSEAFAFGQPVRVPETCKAIKSYSANVLFVLKIEIFTSPLCDRQHFYSNQ